jgi:GxxExxY protein
VNDADLPHLVIGACMNVHRVLGPGLTRDAYEECLAIELRELEFDLERQVPLAFDYRGKRVKTATRLDLVVNGALLVQVRAQEAVTKLEEQQFESLFKLSKLRTGLLVNFNVLTLRKGIRQIMRKRREVS